MRTILIHVNVGVPDYDRRSPREIADQVLAATLFTDDTHEDELIAYEQATRDLDITVPLAEEV